MHSIKVEKVGPTFSSFNPFPPLPSVATDNRNLVRVAMPKDSVK